VISASAQPVEFGPAALRGLSALGPCVPAATDLSLELGLSIWLHCSHTDLDSACLTLLEIRDLVLEEAGLDARTEPVPLLGHSPEVDLKNLAAYLSELLARAATWTGGDPELLIETVIGRLPEPMPSDEDEAGSAAIVQLHDVPRR
jgi:hypothetical protein